MRDAEQAKRILELLGEGIEKLEDPRGLCKPVQGSQLGEFGDRGESAQPRLAVPRSELSARVGDYRLICKIEDDRLLVFGAPHQPPQRNLSPGTSNSREVLSLTHP